MSQRAFVTNDDASRLARRRFGGRDLGQQDGMLRKLRIMIAQLGKGRVRMRGFIPSKVCESGRLGGLGELVG